MTWTGPQGHRQGGGGILARPSEFVSSSIPS